MLCTLPPELFLRVLSHLYVTDISNLVICSHEVYALITSNEDSVYRQVAIDCGLVSLDATLDSALLEPASIGAWMDYVTGWKEFCRRKLLVQSRWNGRDKLYQPHPAGKGKICVGALNGPGDFVSSFVVDEKHRTVISCDRHGGITVTAIETDRVLWRLPGTNAAGYGDCQFSDGFLTFLSSNPRCIEVWRRSGDSQSTFSGDDAVKTPVLDPSAAPSHEQLDNSISASALAVYSEKPPSARFAHILGDWRVRGHFCAHALLEMPRHHHISSYCLSYPLLAAASYDHVSVFDVRNGRTLGGIFFADQVVGLTFSHGHLGISTTRDISIIPLPDLMSSGTSWACLDYPVMTTSTRRTNLLSQVILARAFEQRGQYAGMLVKDAAECPPGIGTSLTVLLEGGKIVHKLNLEYRRTRGLWFSFNTPPRLVCLSPDGHHAVARSDNKLLFIREFSRWIGGKVPHSSLRILEMMDTVADVSWTSECILITTIEGGIHMAPARQQTASSNLEDEWIPHAAHLHQFQIFQPLRSSRIAVTATGIWFLHQASAVEAMSSLHTSDDAYEEDSDGGIGEKNVSNICFFEFSAGLL